MCNLPIFALFNSIMEVLKTNLKLLTPKSGPFERNFTLVLYYDVHIASSMVVPNPRNAAP